MSHVRRVVECVPVNSCPRLGDPHTLACHPPRPASRAPPRPRRTSARRVARPTARSRATNRTGVRPRRAFASTECVRATNASSNDDDARRLTTNDARARQRRRANRCARRPRPRSRRARARRGNSRRRAFEEDSEDELGTRARREDLQRVADDASVRRRAAKRAIARDNTSDRRGGGRREGVGEGEGGSRVQGVYGGRAESVRAVSARR